MRKSGRLSVGLVFDDSLDGYDGVAQYVKTLGGWLVSQGHDVTYLVGQTNLKQWAGGQVYSLAHNLRVVFNGNRLSIPLPAKKRPIRRVIEAHHFDVVHVMMPHSPFMAQKVISELPETTAVVGTFHVYPASRIVTLGGRLLKLWYGRSLRRFDQVVSVSQAAQDYAQTVFGIKSQVVPNPVDLTRFRRAAASDNKTPLVVFLGRLVPRKGCRFLLMAFARMADTSARLIVAGDGPQRRRLESEAEKLGIKKRVEFRGLIDEKDKPGLLASARVACFPSLFGESFGIVLIEAMAAGAGVVIGGDNPGYRTVLGEQPALLVSPADTAALAHLLDKSLELSPQTAALHAWQQETVKQYDVARVGPQLLSIYHQQIARRTKKSNN